MEEIDETMGKGKLIDEIFGEFCEGTYIQPTFITYRNLCQLQSMLELHDKCVQD